MFSLQFSPTGQAWAAATTEGLLIYSLNTGLVFDPWNLEIGITPTTVRETLIKQDYSNGKSIYIAHCLKFVRYTSNSGEKIRCDLRQM